MGIEKDSTACIIASKYLTIAPIAPITPTSPTFAPTLSTVSSQADTTNNHAYLGLNLLDFSVTVALIGFVILSLCSVALYMYLKKVVADKNDTTFTYYSDLYPDRSKSDEWMVQVCMKK